MNDSWYVSRNEVVRGPYTSRAIQKAILKGKISKGDWVRNKSMPTWKEISRIYDFKIKLSEFSARNQIEQSRNYSVDEFGNEIEHICLTCGEKLRRNSNFCVYCKIASTQQERVAPSRGVAILLCFFLGQWGVHRFFVGSYFMGGLYLAISLWPSFVLKQILTRQYSSLKDAATQIFASFVFLGIVKAANTFEIFSWAIKSEKQWNAAYGK